MNNSGIGRDSFGEADVDALLEEFFRHEMPAALRDMRQGRQMAVGETIPVDGRAGETPAPQTVPQLASPRLVAAANQPDRRPRAGWLGLSAAAGALLMVGLLLSQPASRSPQNAVSDAPKATQAGRLHHNRDVAAEPSAGEGAFEVERYDTLNGPVELRMKRVIVIDPETGEEVELSLPELEIEFFPIDDDEADKPTGKRK